MAENRRAQDVGRGGDTAKLRLVLEMLLTAYQSARRERLSPARTALRAALLRTLGLTDRARQRWLEAGILATSRGADAGNEFFYLTPDGATYAASILSGQLLPRRLRPRWIPGLRELWFAHHLVKRFKRAAPNQEAVLSAFHPRWPKQVNNPLPADEQMDRGKQLRETLSDLNESQGFLRFHSDDNGTHVWWEVVWIPHDITR